MDERLALDEIGRMDRRVRAKSAWYGVFCLIISISAAAYVIVSHLLGAGHVAVLWLILGTLLVLGAIYWVHGRRQHVVSRAQAHLDLPMGIGTIGLMGVALALRGVFVPDGLSLWLALVALLPAIPCLVGAWKVLRP
jgi:hypothetical protein